MIFEYIGDFEHYFYIDALPAYKHKNKNKRCNAKTDYDKEIWERDNLINIEHQDLVKLGIGEKSEYKLA